MNGGIEQKITIGKRGFNAFMLNEMMDILASQKVIFDNIAEIKASLSDKDVKETLQELNQAKLLRFMEISEKVLNEYGAIPDDDNIAN